MQAASGADGEGQAGVGGRQGGDEGREGLGADLLEALEVDFAEICRRQGDTASRSVRLGAYSATPMTSVPASKFPWRGRGSWNQLTAVGPHRWMYSRYQDTLSPGKAGFQFSMSDRLCFFLRSFARGPASRPSLGQRCVAATSSTGRSPAQPSARLGARLLRVTP